MSVVFSCVVDNKPLYAYQARLLVTSLLELAGRKASEIVVHLTEDCAPDVEKSFTDLGVRTGRLPVTDSRHVYSNKLAQLKSQLLQDADLVVLCDCDIAFCGDIEPILQTDAVRAKQVDTGQPSAEYWLKINKAAGLNHPDLSAYSTVTKERTSRFNFNGGLLVIPQPTFKQLSLIWPKWNQWLLDNIEVVGPYTTFVDQISFALALEEIRPHVRALQVIYNFPTHLDLTKTNALDLVPKALHYHSRLDSGGFLLATSDSRVNAAITLVNDHIKSARRSGFDNKTFWDFRYSFSPERGSGVGSRGENLLRKRQILEAELARLKPTSVLDVGCGDLEIVSGFDIKHYTGIDVSEQAVVTARAKRPEWSFYAGDVANLAIEPHDLALCMDVLIHQPTRESYEQLVRRLLELGTSYLLIAAYNQPPWFTSELTFYYEPISTTLARLIPESSLEIVGGYRDTTLLLCTRPAAAPPSTSAPMWRRIARRLLSGLHLLKRH